MRGFVFRLIPSRPDFVTTMTEQERAAMDAHAVYWSGLIERKSVVAFGPVNDPACPYGIGIVVAQDLDEAEVLRNADPAVQPPLGFRTEITPMFSLVTAAGRFDAG
jgi:hypothetical protein